MEDEDDILYSCPDNSDHHEPSSLLFIHQSYDQLQILKRYFISFQIYKKNCAAKVLP